MHPRRALFKKIKDSAAQLVPQTRAIRPPWAVSEGQFQKRCTRCGDCVTGCPRKILHYSTEQDLALRFYPVMLLENNGCDFCRACVTRCQTGALSLTEGRRAQALAVLSGMCVKQYGQYCTNCADACPANAISSAPGGIQIDAARCDGCGECTLACGERAIAMEKRPADLPPSS